MSLVDSLGFGVEREMVDVDRRPGQRSEYSETTFNQESQDHVYTLFCSLHCGFGGSTEQESGWNVEGLQIMLLSCATEEAGTLGQGRVAVIERRVLTPKGLTPKGECQPHDPAISEPQAKRRHGAPSTRPLLFLSQ